jgi:iron complex transport system ATP-binding protein
MAEALVATNVSVRRDRRLVLRDVSLVARPGSILAVVGPNGAGKSTLLRALGGLLSSEGTVEVGGTALTSMSARERARRIAYVPQQTFLRSHLSVRDVVTQARHVHRAWSLTTPNHHEPAVERALAATGLQPFAQRSFLRLSGGEQRRVLLARAIAAEARVVLLDEPTAGLDVAHVLSYHQIVRRLADDGACVIAVMHELDSVREHADSAALLHEGRLIACGPTISVVTPKHVSQAYGVRMEERPALRFSLQERSP